MTSTDVTALAEDLLAQARTAPAHRAAHTIYGGSGHALRQTVIAMAAGAELSEHENPGEATLQVLRGSVRLGGADGEVTVAAGGLAVIPPRRHGLTALEDAVVLLTVAKHE